ncbi:MAG: hypothetical protein MZV65_37600 [Chromatiales bacterium]|nr:hypothetical protein [Chromatiales bacterium]
MLLALKNTLAAAAAHLTVARLELCGGDAEHGLALGAAGVQRVWLRFGRDRFSKNTTCRKGAMDFNIIPIRQDAKKSFVV